MNQKIPVTVAKGDGIGPEIMDATLRILEAANAPIEPQFIEVGEKAYLAGLTSGIPEEAWETILRNKVFLKAPITTPQGGGYKSLNVTIRKTLGLYANVRPARTLDPVIPSRYPGMDLVIIRENEEDLYAGIEYTHSPEVTVALKLITRPGCERIIRYAFEYARAHGRKRVTCMTKDNILKITDGLFHKIFDGIAREYPDITADHWIIDIGLAKIADTPADFDVIVMPNLYGDIASDVAGQISGSVGTAGSANIGDEYAMFEAIHGSAPRRAGQNLANPSALLQSAVLMLLHIGAHQVAATIQNAWLRTLEDKVFTYDLARKAKEFGISGVTQVGTSDFASAVIDRLGKCPSVFPPADYSRVATSRLSRPSLSNVRDKPMALQGVDVMIRHDASSARLLGDTLSALSAPDFHLLILSNRGQKVYPGESRTVFCTDLWSARFVFRAPPGNGAHNLVRGLLSRLEAAGFHWTSVNNLYDLEGARAYSLAQGQ
ncbi:MAG: NADP-dependent isocitrate dehydrogenase [bacterium JZ-2024 1]